MSYRPYNTLTASGLSDIRPNNTGVTLPKALPVRTNALGELASINISIEDEAQAIIGVVVSDISSGTSGEVLTSGVLRDISTSADFGDVMYVSKTGFLTNSKPSIGVDGFVADDFVIEVGSISKNTTDPFKKDLNINIDVIGTL